MTVKEAISVLTGANKLYITWDGCNHQIFADDELQVEAYGDYKLKKIEYGNEEDTFELHIAANPIKEVRL